MIPPKMRGNDGYGDFIIYNQIQGHGLCDQIDILGTRFDFLRNQGLSQEERWLKRNQNE